MSGYSGDVEPDTNIMKLSAQSPSKFLVKYHGNAIYSLVPPVDRMDLGSMPTDNSLFKHIYPSSYDPTSDFGASATSVFVFEP